MEADSLKQTAPGRFILRKKSMGQRSRIDFFRGVSLDTCYSVCFGKDTVGKVQVERQGLYYRILCHCQMTGEVMCCLQAQCGDRRENLGVVVPMDGGFGLDTRLPIKRLGEGALSFTLTPRHGQLGTFVPLAPEEPFAYISRLKDAFLERQGNVLGVVIPEK